ncbi:MAG: NuoM family protein [Armatimonadota bacterium]|jgi:NADH-quinone oxidoreductase subunit M|nr:NADH-quinone oxidoreductase subunit M [Fimbriimonadaceae bacterium]MCZ8139191.1 NADH-quinone oxidoreductase subunit M [Fimbriimonadaceae bacterium]
MENTGLGILSLLLAVPVLGAIFLMFIPETFERAIKGASMVFSLVALGVAATVLSQFDGRSFHFQMMEAVPFLPSIGVQWKVGVDGISIWLVVLTTFLTVVANWFSYYIKTRVKTYFVLLQFLQMAMLGVFVSLDLILFYAFFEASLVPMALLVYIWGGSDRAYAARKFFIYTFGASIFMLIGMIALAMQMQKVTGAMTFDLVAIQAQVANGALWANAMQMQTVVFWTFAVAMMVKCPMFPFHTWLPDAHTEAPTAGSVILAGVLLKMGTFGFLRFCLPLFPEAMQNAVPILMTLCVIGIVYGAIVATMQDDVKKLVAYSSVAHMGFVMLGIVSLSSNGLLGGAYQQLNHGISTGALFLLIGLLYERIHTRKFADMGGLKAQMPIFAALFLIVMFSSVGLPGTNGFIGEFLAMMGAFQAGMAGAFGLNIWLPVIAGTGVVFAAVYLLKMFMQVFYGPITNPDLLRLKDIKTHEIVLVGMFIVLIFWGGIYPNTFMKPMESSLGAARMMAVNPQGMRPSWSEPLHEIDQDGNLVQVLPRAEGVALGEYTVQQQIAPANHHFENLREPAEVAQR